MKQTKVMRNLLLVSTLALVTAGCAEKELILSGLREDPRSPAYDVNDPAAVAAATEAAAAEAAGAANRSVPANLGPLTNVASWTHRGGNAAHRVPHATLSAQPQVVWSSKAGAGNERKFRITAEPVADGGRIFTMDSHTLVTAHATAGGEIWSLELTPPGEKAGTGMGGGLALGDGKLFATTTFGELVAIDPATGQVLWRQKFDAALNGAPTVANGQVYVTTAASHAFAVDTDTGRVLWRLAGVATQSGVSGVAAPAVTGNIVIFPLANGSLLGADIGDGTVSWVARVPGDRPGRGHAVLQAFTGEPVVADGVIYAATAAGRAVAVGPSGKLLWKAEEGAQGTFAVAGGSVFFVNDEAKLVRLSSGDGSRIWAVDLPRYVKADKPRRLKSIFPAFGPVMAGGRLWVASGDGYLRAFNPDDGVVSAAVELPAGAASRPITLGGLLYLMTETGDLLALR